MKANAIARIVIYSIIILLLVGILATCLGLGTLTFDLGLRDGTAVVGEVSLSAADVRNLEIDWAAGSVRIETADTSEITFSDNGTDSCPMSYYLDGDTLRLAYSKGQIQIGFVSTPNKDLSVTVPKDWVCEELEINAASVEVDIVDLTVTELDLDGAANEVRFSGSVEKLNCDGASCDLLLLCTTNPSQIDIDGASCSLDLALPYGCGFRAKLDGLSCDFDSDLDYKTSDGNYYYGDEHCKIDVDGVSCDVTVLASEETKEYAVKPADRWTEELLIEPLSESYAAGTTVTVKTEILTDVDLELYVDGVFVSKQSEILNDATHHWEFSFTMPEHDAVIQLKTSGET